MTRCRLYRYYWALTIIRLFPGKLVQGAFKTFLLCLMLTRQQTHSAGSHGNRLASLSSSDQSEAAYLKRNPCSLSIWVCRRRGGGITCGVVHKASLSRMLDLWEGLCTEWNYTIMNKTNLSVKNSSSRQLYLTNQAWLMISINLFFFFMWQIFFI